VIILNFQISQGSVATVRWKSLSSIHRHFPCDCASDRILKVSLHFMINVSNKHRYDQKSSVLF